MRQHTPWAQAGDLWRGHKAVCKLRKKLYNRRYFVKSVTQTR